MLTHDVQSYLAVRRAMGFALHSEGTLLQSFATFSEGAGKTHVCTETAVEWAGLARSTTTRARRLGQVIRFARYIRAEDNRHETPPAVFGCEKGPRPTPYIFSSDDIRRLVQAASELGRRNAFRGRTYGTFFASGVYRSAGVGSDSALF
jgi:integrase/recombinase XerD